MVMNKAALIGVALLLAAIPAQAQTSAQLTLYDNKVSVCDGLASRCMARYRIDLRLEPGILRFGSEQYPAQVYFRNVIWSRASDMDGHVSPLTGDFSAGVDFHITKSLTITLIMSSKHCFDNGDCPKDTGYNALSVKWEQQPR